MSDDFVPDPPSWWQTADPRRLRAANLAVAQRRRKQRKQELARITEQAVQGGGER